MSDPVATDSAAAAPTPAPIVVYLLAAPEDREVCQAIAKHLRPVVRDFVKPIQLNSDFDIPSGADVQSYRQRLLQADIVLVLISSDFIGNDEVYGRVRQVTDRHNRGQTVMVPLLVRNCMWKATPFARLDVLPRNLQPLNSRLAWPSADDALTVVVEDIYASLNQLAQRGEVKLASATSAASVAAVAAAPPTVAPLMSTAQRDSAPLQVSSAEAALPAPPPPGLFDAQSPTVNAQLDPDWRQKYYRNVVWKRAGALVLDYVFAFLVGVLLVAALNLSEDQDAIEGLLISVFYLLMPAFEASKLRATPGKWLMKLQITDGQGERIGFVRAFFRNVLRSLVAYSYILVVPLLFQWWRFKKTKKLFHDELSSTVIGERLSPSGKPMLATGGA